MENKRVTIFAGHYGSGKTNIAVNYAFELRKKFEKVAIADLDIVNPYFRTKDSIKEIKEQGIRLISSDYAGTNVDVPALPGEAYSIIDDKSVQCVIDVGGDDRGALALGRYTKGIATENNYEFLLVINKHRPLTTDLESTVQVINEIQNVTGLKFSAIVNNSNIGDETTATDVLKSVNYAKEISKYIGIPIKMTSVKEEIYPELEGKIENLFILKLQNKQSWI